MLAVLGPIAGVMLIIALAGCSSSTTTTTSGTDSTSGSTASSQSTGQTGVTGVTGDIKIGLLVNLTGDQGMFGEPFTNAANLAIKEINAAGGVLGKQVQLVIADEGSKTDTGIAAIRKLMEADKVSAVVGGLSDTVVAGMPIAEQNKIPLITPIGGTTRLDDGPGVYVLRVVGSDSYDGKVVGRFLVEEKGLKQATIMNENSEGRISVSDAMEKAFTGGGGTIPDRISYEVGQSSYKPEVLKMMSKNPPAVMLGAAPDTGSIVMREAYQNGYRGVWMLTGDMLTDEMITVTGKEVIEGTYGEVPSAPTASDLYKKFANAYRTAYGSDPNPYGAGFYDAIIDVALAMDKAGSNSGEAVAANLREVSNPPGAMVSSYAEGMKELAAGNKINYEGIVGPIDFDKHGNVIGNYNVMQVKDGKWVDVKLYPASGWAQ
ncbi:MAG: ABC transporter substrate-binding protein [Actinobacteria bacterium]|nr:ABC transporter substrate-binding protein [Actinomycetota bacterium]